MIIKITWIIIQETADIKLYTHDLYIDGLGSSTQQILTTWRKNKFTRPKVNLYPTKLVHGFQGHRFILSAIEKPPLVYRRYIYVRRIFQMLCNNFKCFNFHGSSHVKNDAYQEQTILWDGVEIRLLRIIAQLLNFTLEIHDASLSKIK